MISYRAPSEPSALRVAAWRTLKQLGSVKLNDGLYYLPKSPETETALEELRVRLESGGGGALLLTAAGLREVDERSLRDSFDAARTDEFAQVRRWATRLAEHIGREEATDDYRFAEVDTLEEEMEKVRRQFQRAAARDYLGCAERELAAGAVSDASRRLAVYVDEAFRRENGLPPVPREQLAQFVLSGAGIGEPKP